MLSDPLAEAVPQYAHCAPCVRHLQFFMKSGLKLFLFLEEVTHPTCVRTVSCALGKILLSYPRAAALTWAGRCDATWAVE